MGSPLLSPKLLTYGSLSLSPKEYHLPVFVEIYLLKNQRSLTEQRHHPDKVINRSVHLRYKLTLQTSLIQSLNRFLVTDVLVDSANLPIVFNMRP